MAEVSFRGSAPWIVSITEPERKMRKVGILLDKPSAFEDGGEG
jgi:hypothetical protein